MYGIGVITLHEIKYGGKHGDMRTKNMRTKRKRFSLPARKVLLSSMTIIVVVFVFLFINAKIVNRDEELYTTAIPPQLQLSDGTHHVTGILVTKGWYYKGKGNKFYPSTDEDISAITRETGNDPTGNNETGYKETVDKETRNAGDDANKPSVSMQENILEYKGELVLKCSSVHYPDRVELSIYKKENDTMLPLELTLETGEPGSGDEPGSSAEKGPVTEPGSGKEAGAATEQAPAAEPGSALPGYPGYPVFQPKEKGELVYRITAYWDEAKSGERGFYGKAEYEFNFINNVPIEFELSSNQSFPGELLVVYARYAEENDNVVMETSLTKGEVPFYKYDKGKFAIIPLGYELEPSGYTISLTVENDPGASQGKSQSPPYHEIKVDILPNDFPIQHLTISEEVDEATRNDEAYEEYDKYVGAVRKTNTPVKMWEGVFIKPVEGRITTQFGMRRFVNNAPTSYRHSGIDIAADRGTPVMASNSGKVILARYLILTGNTVLIDHGYGIISWSYHMDSIRVKEGEEVKKGQVIGEVGSTGFSTGPHLHYAVSVHDVFTNPWTLFEQEPVIFK